MALNNMADVLIYFSAISSHCCFASKQQYRTKIMKDDIELSMIGLETLPFHPSDSK